MRLNSIFVKRIFLAYWIYFFYLSFYSLTVFVLYQKMGSFGCFDDCFNFMGGWFLLKGKTLYEQIFFNHQPLAAYISAVIQFFGKPASIYQLVFFHRIFIYIYGLLFGLLLLRRFRLSALLFLLIYETTKYYFFGDRFLAEGLIVYPLVYLLGLVFFGLQNRTYSRLDFVVGTLSVWFVIWMREPYIPLTLFLYALFVYFLGSSGKRIISVGIFMLASGMLFFIFPVQDYFFSVITVNSSFHLQTPVTSFDLLKAFFYPIAVLLYGSNTELRFLEVVWSGVFLLLLFLTRKQKKYVKFFSIIFLSLGLANLRPNPPGREFYEAFHMLCWYSLFLFSICFLVLSLRKQYSTWFFWGLMIVLFGSLGIVLTLPSSYMREKTNSQALFYAGYNQYYTAGEVVRRLSTNRQTLFLDGWNDLIYWQAQRVSTYRYSWYTSIMSGFPRYKEARSEFLRVSPPDFFYGACREWPFSKVSKKFLSQYRRFLFSGKPTCLYIKESDAMKLSPEELRKIDDLGYSLESS